MWSEKRVADGSTLHQHHHSTVPPPAEDCNLWLAGWPRLRTAAIADERAQRRQFPRQIRVEIPFWRELMRQDERLLNQTKQPTIRSHDLTFSLTHDRARSNMHTHQHENAAMTHTNSNMHSCHAKALRRQAHQRQWHLQLSPVYKARGMNLKNTFWG